MRVDIPIPLTAPACYPYGTPWNDNAATAGYQAHKYGCKELDLMHGLNLYDFGAREYDPALVLFTSMDPLCEKYYHISPYAYCAGNPVRYRDPNGMIIDLSILSEEELSTLLQMNIILTI